MSRRRIRPESEVPTSRLGHGDKIRMLNKVDTLLARPINLLKCPLTIDEQAELWNSFQDPRGLAAVRTLEELEVNTGRYKTSQVEFLFDAGEITKRPPYKIIFSRRDGARWVNDNNSQFISLQPAEPTWEMFINKLGDKAGVFVNWLEDVVKMNDRVQSARFMYGKVAEMCSTIGQLCRVVPECSRFVTNAKMEVLSEQKKRSPLPEEWYKLDVHQMEDMNTLLSQCQLMPTHENDGNNENLALYGYVTWAKIRGHND